MEPLAPAHGATNQAKLGASARVQASEMLIGCKRAGGHAVILVDEIPALSAAVCVGLVFCKAVCYSLRLESLREIDAMPLEEAPTSLRIKSHWQSVITYVDGVVGHCSGREICRRENGFPVTTAGLEPNEAAVSCGTAISTVPWTCLVMRSSRSASLP